MHDLTTYFSRSMTLHWRVRARVGRKIRWMQADNPDVPREVLVAQLATIVIDRVASEVAAYPPDYQRAYVDHLVSEPTNHLQQFADALTSAGVDPDVVRRVWGQSSP